MNANGRYWFERISPLEKLLICLALAIIAYFIIHINDLYGLTRLMFAWNIFSLSMIVMNWITFNITDSKEIRSQARVQDPKRAIVFGLVLIATIASILAVVMMIIVKEEGKTGMGWRIPLAIAGMVLSWVLIHTLFTLRYAHIYYGNDVDNPTNHAGGLNFPGSKRPEYLDFAYFSFVLGMTFQVSDVEITSRSLRTLALFHGMISFAYNTVMIALVINLTV